MNYILLFFNKRRKVKKINCSTFKKLLSNLDYYSPCTFNNANPSESPNKVMKIHVTAAVTISAFANGKICRTNVIIFKIFEFLESLKV
jgi:hypothetical protein